MQKKNLFLSALVAVAGFGLPAFQAGAAILNYTKGDLILAFRSDSDPNSYLVNLGSAAQFRDATSAFTLNIGATSADLVTAFGSGWSTRDDLYWSVFGGSNNPSGTTAAGDPTRTLYATKAEFSLGVTAEAWTIASSSTQGPVAGKFVNVGDAFASIAGVSNSSTVNSLVGYIQADNATNSFDSQIGSSHFLSFAYFNGGIEGNFGAGAAGTALDLFRLAPSTSVAENGNPGSFEGRFTINSGGAITFTPVPEPSAVGLAIAAFALFAICARRAHRQKQA